MLKYFFNYSLLLMFTVTLSYGQINTADSLTEVINRGGNDTTLAKAYLSLSEVLYNTNIDTMLPLCTKAIAIAEDNLKKKLSADEIKLFKLVKASALNNIGYAHNLKGEMAKALDYYTRSLKLMEDLEEKKGVAQALNNLGAFYQDLGYDEHALNYYQRSLEIKKEISDKKGIANSYNNLAHLLNKRGEHNKALNYYLKSLDLKKKTNNKIGLATALNNIGATYFDLDNMKQAMKYYRESISLQQKIDDIEGVAHSSNNIAEVYLYKNEHDSAFYYASKSLEIANRLNSLYAKKNALSTLYRVYLIKENYKEGWKKYREFILLKDSIQKTENTNAALKQHMQFEFEKESALQDEKNEAKLKEQKLLAEADKKRQNLIILGISGGLVLVLFFLFFLNKRYRLIKTQKGIIDKQKIEVEEKNKEITDSINYAKRIQDAIIPPVKKVKELLPYSFVYYQPKDIVSGDFYWLIHSENNALFAVADCTGHGVPGAMVSVVCNNSLNQAVKEFNLKDPAQILDKTRSLVLETFNSKKKEVKDGMDIALCSMSITGAKAYKKLEYAGANNPLWLVTTREDIDLKSVKLFDEKNKLWLHEIKADKQPIGEHHGKAPFSSQKIGLIEGDTFYLFSDGYPDQFGGEKGKKFKYKPFKHLLLSINGLNMVEQEKALAKHFEKWKGNYEQVDDVCVIGVRV